MSETVFLNINFAKIEFNQDKIISPLLNPDNIRLNISENSFSDEFSKAINKKYLSKGEYFEVLKLLPEIELKEKDITVNFKADKNDILYPELVIDFKVFYCFTHQKKYIAYIPTLGIESYGESEEELNKNIIDNIKLEFSRKKRLKDVSLIIHTLWFDKIQLITKPIKTEFYTLNEIEELNKGNKELYLNKIAQLIDEKEDKTFDLDYEKKQLIKALKGKYSRSILLVGASGIGKTSLIYDVKDEILSNEKVWETTASQIIQKLTEGDGWQQNLSKIIKELSVGKNILFIRSFIDLFETGQYIGNNTSLAEYLKKYIERGEITIITECTEEEYARIDILSSGYLSLFNIINFEDSKSKDLQNIITQKVNLLAKKNNISVEQDAIKELLQLQLRYMPYSGFPGKTIRFLESIILNKKDKQIIDRKTIIKLFCNETGLPDFMIDHSIKINTHEIVEFFKRNIFGQDLAVEIVLNLLMSVKTGLNRNGKPIASLLFVGSTGIGKTEMSKVLAEFMFNNRQKILRFDMSEYSTHESVLRLTGIGFFSEGILTSKVRQEPFSVVLFDELEKAHYSFFDLLLQILGEGRLTDSKGKVTDFCSTIIIMTSNIGARDFQKNPIGFIEKDIKNDAKNHFMKEVQDFFRPELFNRIDQVIPFLPLDKETVKNIVDREIRLISNREGIKYRDTTFDITDKALNYLANKGYDPFYGARQMQRTLRDELLIHLSKKLNSFEINTKLNINIDFTNSLEIHVKGLNVYNKKELGKEDFYKTNISHLRRSLQRLEEGEFFIKLLSNLDILEHKKKKLKEDFWKNNLDSENYTNYTRLKSEFYTLFNQAKELEVSLFLQNFNFSKPMIDNLEKEYNSYSDYIEDFKINLYKLIKPEHKVCTIGIYGQEPFLHDLTDYYKSLAEELDFETKLKYIWHKENYGYHKTDILKADHKDDILTGIELECRGSYPFLYFKDENGKHCFKKNQFEEDKDAIEYVIVVENCKAWDFKTPKNIHRKIFFDEMKSRRMFDNRTFKDSIYNLAFNQEIPYKNLLEEILDIIFSEKFLSILLNGEDEE